MFVLPDNPVQRTGASRHAEWRCGRRGWLAPFADLQHWPLRMITRVITIIAFAALLTGCNRDPDLSALGTQTLKITTFSGGRKAGERSVSPPSREHERMAAWAEQHKTGWSRSYVGYAPGTLVSGTNFSLNIHTSRVILNIGGRQYEHDAPASDFSFLSQ